MGQTGLTMRQGQLRTVPYWIAGPRFPRTQVMTRLSKMSGPLQMHRGATRVPRAREASANRAFKATGRASASAAGTSREIRRARLRGYARKSSSSSTTTRRSRSRITAHGVAPPTKSAARRPAAADCRECRTRSACSTAALEPADRRRSATRPCWSRGTSYPSTLGQRGRGAFEGAISSGSSPQTRAALKGRAHRTC